MEYDISSFLDPKFQYRFATILYQRRNGISDDYRSIPRPECGLLLVTHGDIRFTSGDVRLTANTGDLIFLPKDCMYEAVSASAQNYLINFGTTATQLPKHPALLLSATSASYVDSFRQLMELKLQGMQKTFFFSGQFLLLLEQITADWKKTGMPGYDSILKTALPLLDQEDLSIRQVAERCGISESGFRVLFRKTMGVSPLQYRLNGKISKAQYLLEATDFSVQQIAAMLHFYDEAYFCKLFRQKVGCSPKAYANHQKL